MELGWASFCGPGDAARNHMVPASGWVCVNAVTTGWECEAHSDAPGPGLAQAQGRVSGARGLGWQGRYGARPAPPFPCWCSLTWVYRTPASLLLPCFGPPLAPVLEDWYRPHTPAQLLPHSCPVTTTCCPQSAAAATAILPLFLLPLLLPNPWHASCSGTRWFPAALPRL